MKRTIVYPSGTGPEVGAGVRGAPAEELPDGYADKLLKYIPGEVIAFFLPAYALIEARATWAGWLVLGLGVLGTAGYLLVRSPPDQPPRPWFFVLAGLSFLGWAVGTSTVGTDLWGFPEWLNELVVVVTVFTVPLVDEVITRFRTV